MTSTYEPQVGDVVSLTGTIQAIENTAIRLDGNAGTEWVLKDNVTLVKRPERTVNVELNKSEINQILWSINNGTIYDKLLMAENTLNQVQ